MGTEEKQTYAECEQPRAAGILFFSNAENNNYVSAGFTENQTIMLMLDLHRISMSLKFCCLYCVDIDTK